MLIRNDEAGSERRAKELLPQSAFDMTDVSINLNYGFHGGFCALLLREKRSNKSAIREIDGFGKAKIHPASIASERSFAA